MLSCTVRYIYYCKNTAFIRLHLQIAMPYFAHLSSNLWVLIPLVEALRVISKSFCSSN
uniref:Uncharacterized protein n=1 Tax=Arundo donax TaxID=35708 RepID=A0A0A9G8E6_ARUDO